MAALEYLIGKLTINTELLTHKGTPYKSPHKFVVENRRNSAVAIYVGPANRHDDLAIDNNLNRSTEYLVGGGSFYLDAENRLNLNSVSTDYGFVPIAAAQKFAILIVPQLPIEIVPQAIITEPFDLKPNTFWIGKEL